MNRREIKIHSHGLGIGRHAFGLAPLNAGGCAPALGAAARSPIPKITSPNDPKDPPFPARAAASAPAICSLVTPLVVVGAAVAVAVDVELGARIAALHTWVTAATAITTFVTEPKVMFRYRKGVHLYIQVQFEAAEI